MKLVARSMYEMRLFPRYIVESLSAQKNECYAREIKTKLRAKEFKLIGMWMAWESPSSAMKMVAMVGIVTEPQCAGWEVTKGLLSHF